MAVHYLDVFLHGVFVGKLFSDSGELGFSYDSDYLKSENPQKLSASLPLNEDVFAPELVKPYFSGLLPDERLRVQLSKVLHVSENNIFGLLKAIGGECAGAVSVYPEGHSPKNYVSEPDYVVFDEKRAHDVLTSLSRRPFMAGDGDIRLSGAGAQDKLPIAFVDGKIAVPRNGTPSTHIIKSAIDGYPDSVFNEFFCMKLAKIVRLPVPQVQILWVKDNPYYVVERYDRYIDGKGIVKRLHQEDFCQALRIPPEQKYENEGGPKIQDCFNLIEDRTKSGIMAGKNKITLLEGILFNFLIGNGDAHGKNFSILFEENGAETLSPFYDILCTQVYSGYHKGKMAMKLGGKYRFKDVGIRHFDKLAQENGFREDYVRGVLVRMMNRTAHGVTDLWSEYKKDPKTASPVYKKIVGQIARIHQQMDREQH
nr:type II toxin-antitoxin system HipA family toxin [uncultured Draconibacterium sp.]